MNITSVKFRIAVLISEVYTVFLLIPALMLILMLVSLLVLDEMKPKPK